MAKIWQISDGRSYVVNGDPGTTITYTNSTSNGTAAGKPVTSIPAGATSVTFPSNGAEVEISSDTATIDQVFNAAAAGSGSSSGGSGSAGGVTFQIVTTLPEQGAEGVIYLVKVSETGDDKFEEWIWADSAWESIGTTAVDPTTYAKLVGGNTFEGNQVINGDLTVTGDVSGVTESTYNVVETAETTITPTAGTWVRYTGSATVLTVEEPGWDGEAEISYLETAAPVDLQGVTWSPAKPILTGNGPFVYTLVHAGPGQMLAGAYGYSVATAEAVQAVVPIKWGEYTTPPSVSGMGCIVLGDGAKTDKQGVVIGASASGQGEQIVAIGAAAKVTGVQGVSVGFNTNSVAFGVACGCNAKARGGSSIAVGGAARAEKIKALAVGDLAVCSATNGIAVGAAATTNAQNALTLGVFFTENVDGQTVTHTCTTEGTGSITIGAGANTKNSTKTVEGVETTVESSNSITIGCKAINQGADSVVIGASASNEKAGSVIIGTGANDTGSWGNKNTIIGINANAKGSSAVSVGEVAKATNDRAVAIGSASKASAFSSMAFGFNATAADTATAVWAVTNTNYTKTQLYFSGAGTPLADQYYNGEAFMGYTVTDNAGTVLACGTRRLSELFTDNTLNQAATIDEETGDYVMPTVFHPSDLDLPVEEPTDDPEDVTINIPEPTIPEPEPYTPLPVYPIVEPEDTTNIPDPEPYTPLPVYPIVEPEVPEIPEM